MRRDLNIVLFGFNDWETWKAGGFFTRCAKLVTMLGSRPETGKILVVGTPKSIFTRIWRSMTGRADYDGEFLRSGIWFSLRRVESKIYVLDQFRLFPREDSSSLIFKINGLIHNGRLRAQLKKTCAELAMRDYLLWLANPLMAQHMGHLNERLTLFDAIDDWRVHPRKKKVRRILDKAYKTVAVKADIILTVSKLLSEEFSKGRQDVHWLPNGVEVDRFSRPQPIPSEIAGLPRPIIEYIGTLQERVDVEILERIAVQMPTASLVLVGPLVTPDHFKPLRNLSNVHFIPRTAPTEMPAFIQHADVCVMPHVKDRFTASMNPLKLYEYIAAGKPVVATRVDGLEEFEGFVDFADDAEEFLRLIERAMADGDGRLGSGRASFLKTCDWEVKTDQVLEIVLNRARQAHAGAR